MSRRDAVFVEGGYYHIYNRGCNQVTIFRERENYRYLLRLIAEATGSNDISTVAFCLMPNHYHFLFSQNSERPISVAMQQAFNAYVKAFNSRLNRTGTLFEGAFKAKKIRGEDYLAHLCRYIHRNPLDAGLVGSIDEWEFSDYLEWIGKRNRFLGRRAIVTPFFSTPDEYARFVKEYEPPAGLTKKLQQYYLD
jgi:REP element-mobilizing transposase RayT